MQHQLISSKLKVAINSFGAEIFSVKDLGGLEYIWQANKEIWPRHAPVLFPIVGRLKDNFFNFNNKQYELPQHGFARDSDFTLIEFSETNASYQLASSNKTKIWFPFDFIFQISYALIENTLNVNYKVVNPALEPLYFSVGGHPGFNCPMLPSESFEDYYLEFKGNEFLETQLTNGLRTDVKYPLQLKDNKLFLTKNLFDNDALVFENSQINEISLCSRKNQNKITLQCNNWPYFGIWGKKGNTNFICLEPWYGVADTTSTSHELVEKAGIIKLDGNKEFNCRFSIIFG